MLEIPIATKAAIAQTSIATALRYAGYSVTSYGIEEQCPELVRLDSTEYRALDLPEALRSSPDLLVYSQTLGTLQLAEIKFTRSWTGDVIRMMMPKLARQQAIFPCAITVILRSATAASVPNGIDDFVRVLPPDQLLLLATAQVLGDSSLPAEPGTAVADPALEKIWDRLIPLPEAFPLLTGHPDWGEILRRTLPALGTPT